MFTEDDLDQSTFYSQQESKSKSRNPSHCKYGDHIYRRHIKIYQNKNYGHCLESLSNYIFSFRFFQLDSYFKGSPYFKGVYEGCAVRELR